MRKIWLVVLACLVVTSIGNPLRAQDNSDKKQDPAPADSTKNADAKGDSEPDGEKEAKPQTRSEKMAAAVTKYNTAMKEFMAAYRKATDEEKPALVESSYPKPQDYAAEFLALALEQPDDDVAFQALTWIATNVRSGDSADKAYGLIFANHIDHEDLNLACSRMAFAGPAKNVETRLNLVIKQSPHDSVKAAATYALASYLGRLESARGYLTDNPEQSRFDEATVDYLAMADASPMRIEGLYQALIDHYADLAPSKTSKRTYKSMAVSALFEMTRLQIGMVVPDIEAEDFDGKSFKLSDYRGKVVVIDFWGDW